MKQDDNKIKTVSARMPLLLYEKLSRLAESEGRMVTNSEMLRRLVEQAKEKKHG